MGFTSSDAVRMFFHQVVISNGLPFDVKLPNAETIQAMEDIQNGTDLTRLESVADLEKLVNDL